jgi:hypothetical protein
MTLSPSRAHRQHAQKTEFGVAGIGNRLSEDTGHLSLSFRAILGACG